MKTLIVVGLLTGVAGCADFMQGVHQAQQEEAAKRAPRQPGPWDCTPQMTESECDDRLASHSSYAASLSGRDGNAAYVAARQGLCLHEAARLPDKQQESAAVQQCYKTWPYFTAAPTQQPAASTNCQRVGDQVNCVSR